MTRNAQAVLWWLLTLVAGVAMLANGGCTWGLEARRAYDAAARAKHDEAALEETTKLKAGLAAVRNGIDRNAEPTLYCMVEDLSKPVQQLEDLAASDLGRARIAQLDHGTPPELAVELGNDKDKDEVVAYAGMASERQSKRIWRKDRWKHLGRAVADFASGIAAGGAVGVREVVTTLVPAWLLWTAGAAIVVAMVIGLYALYQRIVIHRKDRALDEYDEFGERILEGRPHHEKAALAIGDHLRREHFHRNERRKRQGGRSLTQRAQGVEIRSVTRECTPPDGVPSDRDMLPDLPIRTPSAVDTTSSDG